jgi:hypothetical protein
MFSSVSGCVPNSRIRLSFVSLIDQSLGITTTIPVYVGIAQIIVRPVMLLAGDTVEIEIDTPPGYLGYQFYEYTLNDAAHSFAVVNQNDYRPTLKPNDAPRKWFNYFPKELRTSFYDAGGTQTRPIGRGINFVNIDTTHVVLDHIKERVNFYSPNRELVTSVYLPSGPVEYKKSEYYDSTNTLRVELFVICNDKRLYRIRFDNQFSESSEFFPTVTFIRSLELIWYEADLPTGESYVDNRRNSLRSKVNPPMTALDVFGGSIWVAGYDTVYVLNKNFQTLATIRIGTESIVSISCLTENTAYAITREGKIYQVTSAGAYNMFYDAARPLGVPARVDTFGNTPVIVVPDPHHQRLLKITGPTAPVLAESVATLGYAPAYARVFDDSLLITSYDNNEVLRYTSWNDRYVYEFNEKVTIASWVKDKTSHTLLAVHYLKDYVTLNLTGIEKVIPITIKNLKGPITHMGSDPVKLIMLGQESIMLHPGPGLTCWVNGIKDEPASTGDNFSVSYKATGSGQYRTACVLGDRAYDVDITVVGDAEYLKSYTSGAVGINRLSTLTNVSVITTPTLGNIQTGTTLLNLGFTWNFFGNAYTQVNVSTNGFVSFGNNIPTGQFVTVGGLNIDALYVEPTDLYQGLAINNTDPNNITFSPLSTGETPGVYYESGSVLGFGYQRIRWVGINGAPEPTGNTIIARTSLSSSPDIPSIAAEFSKASPGDYVSAVGISLPTRVIGTYVTPIFEFSIYKLLAGGQVLVTSYNANVLSVARYSAVNETAAYVTARSWTLRVKAGTRQNHLLAIFDKTAIIDGSIDPSITNDWAMRVPRFGSVPNFVYQTGITSIVETTHNITCLGVRVVTDQSGLVTGTVPEDMYVSAADYGLILTNQTLSGVSVSGAPFVTNKTIDGNVYIISTNLPHGLVNGDVFAVTRTTITTATFMPTLANNGVTLNRQVSFEFSSLTLNTTAGFSTGDIVVRGRFITVDTPVTVASGATITFKTNQPADEYMYEVGLYQSSKYQFIEYFYNNSAHSATSNIGMATGARLTGKRIVSNTAPAGSSIVFYSEIGTGIFKPLGLGSFDFYSAPGIVAPKISKGINNSDYDYTVEFYVDQELTTQSNVYLAASYGLLHLNGSRYTTDRTIKKNDLIQLTAPFNRALRAIAPIISLGNDQFPVPMRANAAIDALIRHTFVTDNLPLNSIVSLALTVPASDYYYVPDLYRFGASVFPDFQYIVSRAGSNISLQAGSTYDLFVGDQLTIGGVLTSKISADTRDVVLIGQTNAIIATAKTAGPGLVDYLTFDTLIEPYTDNYYSFSNISNVYVEDLSFYETANIVLTTSSNITTANLYVGDVDTTFVINGVRLGNYVANVPIGSNISIRRNLIDYFQSNVVIYQVESDAAANGNIYLPIGQWNVDNKIILGGNLVQSNSSTVELESQLFGLHSSFDFALNPNNTLPSIFELGSILPLVKNPTTFVSDRVIGEFASVGTYSTFGLVSNFIGNDTTYILTDSVSKNFLEPNYIKIKEISHQYINTGTYKLIDTIQSYYFTPVKFFTDDIQSRYATGPTEMQISGISGIPGYSPTEMKISDISAIAGYGTTFSLSSAESELLTNYSILGIETAAEILELFNYLDIEFVFGLEEIITNIKSSFEADPENYYNFNLIAPPEAISGTVGNYGVLASQIAKWEESFNYLSTATQGDLEKLIQIFSSKFDSMVPDRYTEFSSIVESQYEQLATSFRDRTESATFKKIQEIVGTVRSLREQLGSEFQSNIQSSHENNNTILNFNNDLMMDLLKTELVLTLTFNNLTQAWTDVPQFDFERSLPPIDHFHTNDAEKYYLNLIMSDADRADLLEQATELSIPSEASVAEFSELLIPLLPINKAFTVLNIPFTPLRDLPPVYFIPFDPLLDRPPQILIPLTVMLDIVPEQIIPFDPVLFQDIIWTMEDSIPSVGAVSTYIHYWADQGQFNDKWNLRDFDTNNYNRAYNPLVLYTKEYIYQPGGFYNDSDAEDEKVKYYNAGILQIPGTDFWNYRIYFKDRHFCVPRKGRIFPVTWYIRGG